jgi:hypothetical protein
MSSTTSSSLDLVAEMDCKQYFWCLVFGDYSDIRREFIDHLNFNAFHVQAEFVWRESLNSVILEHLALFVDIT